MVVNEPEFQVPSESAIEAVKSATKLIEWAARPTGKVEFTTFFSRIEAEFQTCFVHKGSLKTREEAMWRRYISQA